MLPVYVSYFAGGEKISFGKTLKNSLGFVLGFTVLFVMMGALAGTVGNFLSRYKILLNIVSGVIVIFFGLNYIGAFRINIFKGFSRNADAKKLGFFSSVIFGMIFSVGWTPCVGAFLGSALMMAAGSGRVLEGVVMLLVYSLGLGIPFIFSALLIDKLKGTFNFIKRNYKTINIVCGSLLIVVGVLMTSGLFGKLVSLLA
jgi:cytochrome c-type biogenesis protein